MKNTILVSFLILIAYIMGNGITYGKPDGRQKEKFPLEGCPKGGVEKDWKQKALFPYYLLPKNRKLTQRARELRKAGVLSEVVFWKAFKDKRSLGWDIDRQ